MVEKVLFWVKFSEWSFWWTYIFWGPLNLKIIFLAVGLNMCVSSDLYQFKKEFFSFEFEFPGKRFLSHLFDFFRNRNRVLFDSKYFSQVIILKSYCDWILSYKQSFCYLYGAQSLITLFQNLYFFIFFVLCFYTRDVKQKQWWTQYLYIYIVT